MRLKTRMTKQGLPQLVHLLAVAEKKDNYLRWLKLEARGGGWLKKVVAYWLCEAAEGNVKTQMGKNV